MQPAMIRIENVSHYFGEQLVLKNISIEVPEGSIYGFLGPNGAGKTTTLRLLLGLLKKQHGSIQLFGKDLAANRIGLLKRIGSLIEQPSLYGHLTAKENLEIFRLGYGCNSKRIAEVLSMVDLSATGNKKVKAFSLGMKQRLSVAIAMLHNPELLILDEPTNGLDPAGIVETRQLISQLNREHGKTVIISSHILPEIEKMATHLGIIHKGKIIFEGSMDQLQKEQARASVIEIETNDMEKAKNVLQNDFSPRHVGEKLILPFKDKDQMAKINSLLVQHGLQVNKLIITQNDLENVFIQITAE